MKVLFSAAAELDCQRTVYPLTVKSVYLLLIFPWFDVLALDLPVLKGLEPTTVLTIVLIKVVLIKVVLI